MTVRARHVLAAMIAAGGFLIVARAPAQPQTAAFPDVPPWHWAYNAIVQDSQAGIVVGYPAGPAELIANSVAQVYDAFVHAQVPGAQAWAERFTFDRPGRWPEPLTRSPLAGFTIRDVRIAVTGDTATAAFTAQRIVRTTAGSSALPMRVGLRLLDGDWQIDYATLAAGDPIFR
jgi:hypothetical protein